MLFLVRMDVNIPRDLPVAQANEIKDLIAHGIAHSTPHIPHRTGQTRPLAVMSQTLRAL